MNILGFTRTDIRPTLNFLSISIADRYLGSHLGRVWAILNPLMMLILYTFVFGYVFKVRLPGAETTLAYAIWLISGYGPWIAISESLTAAASSVVSASGLIKNVAFKTEILPVVAVLTSTVTLAVTMVFLVVLMAIDGNPPSWHAVTVLPVIVVQYLFLGGVGFFLAALTVFYRDILQVLPNLLMVAMFGSPILYPMESMPRMLKLASNVNPFYILAEGFRSALVYHKLPDFASLAALAAFSFVLATAGVRLFRRAKGQFGAYL